MARQHMHNRRASRGSAGGGASWISYSDMMAALLLIFVLVLCYSLFQYFSMLESKTKELDSQKQLLTVQEAELDEKTQALLSAQAELQKKEDDLQDAQTVLVKAQADLEDAKKLLLVREEDLNKLQQQVESQQQALLDTTKQLDGLIGVRTRIIQDLSSSLAQAALKAAVDPQTGDIVLDSAVFFDTAKSNIREEGKAFLDRFVPVYLNVLLSDKYKDYLGEIIIEGHTDSTGTYNNNLKLSQERALQVALYCLEMPTLSREQKLRLQQILTAKGRSFADLKYDENGNEDPDASRRVEFKFSLKDTEMINEMNRLLQTGQGSG